MAHAWNACWVNALGGSNPPSSALHTEHPGFTAGVFCISLDFEVIVSMLSKVYCAMSLPKHKYGVHTEYSIGCVA